MIMGHLNCSYLESPFRQCKQEGVGAHNDSHL